MCLSDTHPLFSPLRDPQLLRAGREGGHAQTQQQGVAKRDRRTLRWLQVLLDTWKALWMAGQG